MKVHARKSVSVEPAHVQVDTIQSSKRLIEEQETQICKAMVPVKKRDESPPFIMLRNLKKTYRYGTFAQPALVGVSLQIEPGEFVIVTGSPGSGKSTLLHILACMAPPSSGAYWLGGSRVGQLSTDMLATLRNQRIGFIFQEPALLPHVSARDNVALPLLYAGFGEAERNRRAQKVLHYINPASRIHLTPEHLSLEQQQRVAIARALVNSPSLLLADEPTGNMDTRSEKEIIAILQALNQRKLTIVMATQNAELAPYAKRHLILHNGNVISDQRIARQRFALNELVPLVSPALLVKQEEFPINMNTQREEMV